MLEVIRDAALGHLSSIPLVGSTGFVLGGWGGAIALLANPPIILLCAAVGVATGIALSKIYANECEVIPIEVGRELKARRNHAR